MNLYAGKMLYIDLTAGKITTQPLKREWLKDYWGCWGLAVRYYWDLVDPKVDPLSPQNAMVIMTGPFGGTLVPLTSRFCLVSKSPHTGTIFETNAGGAFGPELKFAGYDGIIITGRANSLSYLKIADDQVSLENASGLAGKGMLETEQSLKKAIGSAEAKTLAIGPAGENLVTYACVGTESYRQLGRGGAGALFGSKNLKGIVCRGSGSVQVADLPVFIQKINEFTRTHLFHHEQLWPKTDGTTGLTDPVNEAGFLPTRNFTYGVNASSKKINADAIRKVKIGDRACFSCALACGKYTRVNDVEVEGPEYETIILAGSNCEIHDMEQLIRFNILCDDLGLDTMSCGNIIALAMDMTEKGRHNFNLEFGQAKEWLNVVREIANLSTERGKDLAMGAKKMAEKYQSTDLSTEIKGLELPGYEPRGNYGMGLGYATSERGGCHTRAFPLFPDDPFDISAMSKAVADDQNAKAIKWSMGLCDFWETVTVEMIAELLTIGLGEKVQARQMIPSGEKIWNLTRLFNLRAGVIGKDDTLPNKIMKQPLQKGPQEGRVFGEETFTSAKKLYYQIRGWDEDGVPSRQKLTELGLDQL